MCPALAQQPDEAVAARTFDLPPTLPGEYNGDVRHLPPVYVPRRYLLLNEFEAPPHHKPVVDQAAMAPQTNAPAAPLAAMPAPSANFPGLAFSTPVSGGTAGGGWPPDTNGDVGPTVYVQSVNTAFGIFSKANGALLAAFTEDQLWSASGLPVSNPCNGSNDGDPVVLHDALHDRWLLTDFAFAFDIHNNPVGPFYECIAVSKTADPVAGGWWFYSVRMDAGSVPVNTLADYPKFGLWNDGCLYMGANAFDNTSGSYLGPVFASFNTTNLYAGAALTSSVGFLANSSIFGMFPANLLGTAAGSMPPTGRQEFFVAESTSGFSFDVRKFTKGANCGGGGSLGSAVSVNQSGYGYPAIKAMGSYTEDMVPQSGTTNRLDSLGDRIMQKVQYRKLGTAESLWVVHTTCGAAQNVDGACASNSSPVQPQWAQINVSNGTVSTAPVQQQIYAPDTTLSRWMASVAVDAQGNMALGYSTSGAAAFPSIRYAGRLVSDTKNTLPRSEVQLVAGAGAQTKKISGSFVSRWGDYSSMSMDPDDCTFWYTNEYYDNQTNGTNGNWQTRIGAFKFPGCIPPPTKLAFTQQPAASYTSGATITIKVSVEDAGGHVITSDNSAITLALQGGTSGAILSGTKTVNAVAGVATFNVAVNLAGTAYVLHATDGALTAADSTAFNITHGVAKKLAFATQPPASTQAGSNFGAVVVVQDSAGNTVTSDNSSVTLNLTCSCASVGGNVVIVSGGVATFTALNIGKAGTGYQLRATDSNAGLAATTSSAFDITTGPAASVVLTTQPAANSNIAAGAGIPLIAHVQDSKGNPVANDSVTLAFANNAGSSTLSVLSDPVVTDGAGNAAFANVSLDKAHSGYSLKVTEAAKAHSATSNAFNIVAGAPAQLAFTTQPTDVTQGGTLGTIAVTEQDQFGNTVTGDSASSVDFTVSACGGTPLGSATMSHGVATLPGAQVFNALRAGLDVSANAASLSLAAVSQAFNVGPDDLLFADGYEACAL